MKLKLVVLTRLVTLKKQFLSGSTSFTEAYDCTLSCGHSRTISGLTHGSPPKKLKCTSKSCKES